MMNRARKLLRKFPSGQVPLAIAVLGAACLFEPTIVFAQSSSGGAFAPIQTAVQLIIDFITGPFGRAIAILAVVSLGLMAFAGRLSWFTVGFVVIGIGLVFGAPAIVDQLISSVGA
jgi:type IV secretion system protein VirB2